MDSNNMHTVECNQKRIIKSAYSSSEEDDDDDDGSSASESNALAEDLSNYVTSDSTLSDVEEDLDESFEEELNNIVYDLSNFNNSDQPIAISSNINVTIYNENNGTTNGENDKTTDEHKNDGGNQEVINGNTDKGGKNATVNNINEDDADLENDSSTLSSQ